MTTTLATNTRHTGAAAAGSNGATRIYWHRQLPPVEAEMIAEHVLEASSHRVSGSLAHRDELWDSCYHDLMQNAQLRLKQEIDRLGGHYAHVLGESVDSRRDDAAGEAWLCGRFTYVLYRRPRELSHVAAQSG